MPDKTSATVYMGIPVGIDNNHPDYLPLMFGTYVLGGNFSARLMSTVRDQEGLTYGIGSSLSGTTLSDGNWSLSADFAPALLDKGMNSTMRELRAWVQEGISEEELRAKKSTISGTAKVQLATTTGMANYIHNLVVSGKDLSYADRYFDEINALTKERVNEVIKKYIDLDKLVVVKAGTLKENSKSQQSD
jgi:zinc protease